ncbi:hypothetical protein MHM88_13100 [Epibacterium sp. MM17-32]|nr:hypothetical protein [Epibacterium sp. MM17-32]
MNVARWICAENMHLNCFLTVGLLSESDAAARAHSISDNSSGSMSDTNKTDRRRSRFEVTPETEDRGLFKRGLTQVALTLVPVIGKTARGDISVRGYVSESEEISVIFAGRRIKEFGPLHEELRRLLTEANYSAQRRRKDPPPVNSIRLPAQIEGAWRVRFERSNTGEDIRVLQFLAARWGFLDRNGETITSGKQALYGNRSSDAGAI